jgi:hypothetical protein
VGHYNDVRLNTAIGYITPKDMLAGRQQEIMLGGIGSWRRHGSNGRFAASKPLDVQLKSVVLARFIRTPPRVRSLNFRFADDTTGARDRPCSLWLQLARVPHHVLHHLEDSFSVKRLFLQDVLGLSPFLRGEDDHCCMVVRRGTGGNHLAGFH